MTTGLRGAYWVLLLLLVVATPTFADNWPTYRHDNRRSGVTADKVTLPLKEAWKRTSPAPPQPAWEGPAKWDAYAAIRGLASMRDFDLTFFVTVAGGRVYYGSSVDDAVHCLDAAGGKELWSYVTGGPVRLPPALVDGRAYFGSDDGYAYCVEATAGKLVWRYKAAPEDRRIPSNGKLISLWPVRTGVLVADSKAYFGASLLPWRTSYLCAVDARTGSDKGSGLYKAEMSDAALQGAMLSTADRLFVMQGRQSPVMFQRSSGRALKHVGKGPAWRSVGGVFGVLTENNQFSYGPGNKKPTLHVHDGNKGTKLVSFTGARRLLVTSGMSYIYRAGHLEGGPLLQKSSAGVADVRKLYMEYVQHQSRVRGLKNQVAAASGEQKAQLEKQLAEAEKAKAAAKASLDAAKGGGSSAKPWKIAFPAAHDMILAGEVLFVGGDDVVTALDAGTGKPLWTGQVSGRAHGLAVAGGRLFVSTHDGTTHCFAAK